MLFLVFVLCLYKINTAKLSDIKFPERSFLRNNYIIRRYEKFGMQKIYIRSYVVS